MSLNVYLTREEIPKEIKVIDRNDIFFNGYTYLTGSSFESLVLSSIDKAKMTSDSTFSGRTFSLGNLNKSFLSTGTKTLLNIFNHTDICFNVIECGNNALELLCDLHSGNILWSNPFINILRDDESCDIECRGRHFSNICDFIDFDWGD